ncbi:MAG: OmpA family protein [Proteobacteria bacterium]|nr:OmpA family protein [Pseudomonadota bacterium]
MSSPFRICFAALAALSLSVPAASDAPAPPGSYDYFALVPAYVFPDRSLATQGRGFALTALYGRAVSSRLALEFNVNGAIFETGPAAGTDFYQKGLSADLVYNFTSQDRVLRPYALVGIGGAYDDFYPNHLAGAALLVDAGAGLTTRPLFGDRVSLRFEARYVRDSRDGGHSEPRVGLGIQIPLGRPVVVREVTVERVVEREVVREVTRPWVDSDGDGVDDEHDLCPGTPPGVRVDAHGCAIPDQVIELRGVTFEFNKARLTPNAQTVLDGVALAFIGQPTLRVEIAGHTDSTGSVAANLTLSQRRAEAVRDYLLSRGAQPAQITARGYGKSEPKFSPEHTDEQRERNRRVELRTLEP